MRDGDQKRRIDLQDVLLLCGVLLIEAGVAVIWWPAALILGGLFCLAFAFMIERSKRIGGQPGDTK